MTAATRARDRAIEAAAFGVPDWWAEAALTAIEDIAARRERFTTDAIWFLLEARGIPDPPEPRALGALLRLATRMGTVKPTPDFVNSTRKENHARPIRVWASQLEVAA